MTAPQLTSIIMVTYHTGPILDRAIASVLAQTADVELVLVNNGNPPEIEAKLIERFKDEPLVRLMTGHGNIGASRGRNLGARVARGDRFLFLSPDCILQPDAVARLIQVEQEIKRPFLLGARIVDDQKRNSPKARQNLLTPLTALVEGLNLYSLFPKVRNIAREPMPKAIAPIPAIGGDFMYITRADLVRVRGFDEGYFAGPVAMDFCARFRRLEGQIYFVPSVIVVQPRRAPTRIEPLFEKNRTQGLIRYFHENFSHIYPQPVLWLLHLGIVVWSAVSLMAKQTQSLKKR